MDAKLNLLVRFIEVANAALKGMGAHSFFAYMSISCSDFVAYASQFSVAEIQESTRCIILGEWHNAPLVCGLEMAMAA